jgi:cyanoexosortase A
VDRLSTPSQKQRIPSLWLLAALGCLLAIHIALNLRSHKYSHLAMSGLFWAAALSILWDKRGQLKFESNTVCRSLGGLLILCVLVASVSRIAGSGRFLGFSPLISVLGLVLVSSGWQGLKQHCQELFLLLCLGMPQVLLKFLPDISLLSAKFATYLLWYAGFDVTRQGVHITIPRGGVEVIPSCSGLDLMSYMLGVAIIFLTITPSNLMERIIAPIVSVLLGFFNNAIRIAALTALSANSNRAAFTYWHSNEGAFMFVISTIVLFGGFCWFLMHKKDRGQLESRHQSPFTAVER